MVELDQRITHNGILYEQTPSGMIILGSEIVCTLKRASPTWTLHADDKQTMLIPPGASMYHTGCECEDFPACVPFYWSPCRQIERAPDLHMNPCLNDDCRPCEIVAAGYDWSEWTEQNPHGWPNWSTETGRP